MWQALSAKTPCGIIECGDLADAHDSVILADHRRVALGIAHGICQAFGVIWKGDPNQAPAIPTPPIPPTPPTQPSDPCEGIKKQFEELQKEFNDYKIKHPDIAVPPVPPADMPVVHKDFFKQFTAWVQAFNNSPK